MAEGQRLGLIAGNGSFPLLLLDAARAQGAQVIVAAIKEETSPLIESRGAAQVQWMSLGELSKLIDFFKREGVSTAIMAGQAAGQGALISWDAQHRFFDRRSGQGA